MLLELEFKRPGNRDERFIGQTRLTGFVRDRVCMRGGINGERTGIEGLRRVCRRMVADCDEEKLSCVRTELWMRGKMRISI